MTFRVTLSIAALALLSLSAQGQGVQKINTYAGNGAAGYGGDGGNAPSAELFDPEDVVLDANMNVYIADVGNNRIRLVNASTNVITTIAGTGFPGNDGNGGIASSADIFIKGIAIDNRGNIYFSDPANNVIRKINRLNIISQYAGGGPAGTSVIEGYSGDGGKADTARFSLPQGIAVDDTGNLYIADAGNHVIRKIDTFGYISTFAGTGVAGYIGDGGPAVAAELDSPYAVAVDRYHNVYINDYKNDVIRMVDSTNFVITTYAGNGTPGYSGDGGPATLAALHDARGLAVDTAGNLYIADALNNVIRQVSIATGIITTVVGNGSAGFGGDLGYVTGCNLFNPYGMAVDKYGDIFVADAANERIRKTYYTTGVPNVTTGTTLSVYPNPCSTEVTVCGLAASDNVSVIDITGREVRTWQATSAGTQTYNVSELAQGVYMLKVSGNDGMLKAVVKLVKE